MKFRSFCCAVGALWCFAGGLRAQAPIVVPMGDPAYGAVDRLAGAGLVDTMLTGQRPYTRAEFARILRGVVRDTAGAPGRVTPGVRREIERLSERFGTGSGGSTPPVRLIDEIALTLTSTDEQPRWVPPRNGAGGTTHAFVAPLALEAQSGGRDAMQGTTVGLESWHRFALGSHVTIEAHPRLRLSTDSSFAGEHTVSFQELSASTRFSNAIVAVGRQHLDWGLGRHDKLFLSGEWPGTRHDSRGERSALGATGIPARAWRQLGLDLHRRPRSTPVLPAYEADRVQVEHRAHVGPSNSDSVRSTSWAAPARPRPIF